MKSFLFSSFLLLFSGVISAQVGIGTTSPNGALDVTSATDGLLIPRVALVNTTTVTVLTGTASELVYNTATVGDVTPGFYYLSTATGPWVRLATGSGNGWLITGNTGIVDGTNFMGTAALTNVDVAFRRNNIAAGKLSATSTSYGVGALTAGAATNNAAFGNNALTLSTGADNVAVGTNALAANTTGATNTAVGRSALAANVTATGNTGIGFTALAANTGGDNTAVGYQALTANTSGIQNTSLGVYALQQKTTGSANTAVGHSALNAAGTFDNATAVGFQALRVNTASNNTGIGFQALASNTSGLQNTAVGFQANSSNVTGSANTAVGYSALGRNTGNNNTVMGYEAMFGAISSASDVTAIGWHALFNNSANESTAVGSYALQGSGSAVGNTALGYRTLNNNSTGQFNTAVGNQAGFAATSSNNTFVGYFAGQFSGGANNTVVGSNALKANAATANTVAIGYQALAVNTSTNNTAVGYNALVTSTSGGNNTALGYNTLPINTVGTGNVAIGNNAGAAETGSDKLYITNSATSATTSLIYGEFSPARILRTNSTFQIGDPATTGYVFPAARGTINQVLQTNGTGVLSWVAPSTLITETDPQVSSATTNVIPKWNGTTLIDGQVIDNGTSVGIGMTPLAANKLDVNGRTRTTTFQMTTAPALNYVLRSDAAGLATWVNPSTIETDPQVTSTATSAIPRWNGTTLVDGVITDDGTNVGVGAAPTVGNKLDVTGKTKTTNFQMTNGAVANYVLQSDGTGNAAWVNPTALTVTETDPQVSSTATSSVPRWNGTTLVDGVVTDDGTNVGIGTAPSVGNKLDVAGNTKTTNFQMSTGASAGYVLQSDGAGNASWTNATVKPFNTTGAATGIYTVTLAQYTIRVFNGVSEVRLPDAVANPGKEYIIIGSNTISSKTLSTSGGLIYDDVTNSFISTINSNERIMVQSDGSDWIVTGR